MASGGADKPVEAESYASMDRGDVEAIGAHCQLPECHQLDFLPFRCLSCKGTYCLDHRSETAHRCASEGAWAAARRKAELKGASSTTTTSRPTVTTATQCSHPQCKTFINTPQSLGVLCSTCHRQYCVKHRLNEEHDCAKLVPLGARPGNASFMPSLQTEKAKMALSKLRAWGKGKQADLMPKPRPSSNAARIVALNQLKKTAKGDGKIPIENRVYLHIEASADTTTAKYPTGNFFYSKDVSVGRVLDLAAKSLQVQNINNRGGGEEQKLRVFHVEGGRLLEFGEKVSESLVIDRLRQAIDPTYHVQTRSTEQPFLVYDPSFLEIIGSTPTLQVLLEDAHPIFHEAGVFIDDTIYITSNRHDHLGNGEAGIRIHKVPISRDETTGAVTATSCIEQANETVPMANGGINYKRGILFCAQGRQGEGAGTAVASSLVHVHSLDPFQGQEILNNYHGRAFNSPNDVVVHSGDGSIWFTDPIYGWEQGFRPAPALPNQVYRFDPATGDVRVVADGFNRPNGICFAPDEKTVYITDTDFIHGDGSTDGNRAATVYAYDLVATAGNAHLSNRRVFAHADAGAPDGIKCDVKGHVYSGCGDGVHVWNSRGMLIGKIAVPGGIANFCFGDGGAGWRAKLETSQGGKGKELDGEYGELFLLNETKLWYVRLGKGVRGALLNPPH